jgi:predicted nuclease of predicted toxin-antitoxin system
MKIIIDECVPHIVKKRLPHRQIKTVQDEGWAGIKNGELLRLAEAEFDVFITSDKNLRYQQNLKNRKIALLLLPSNQVPIIENLLPQIDEALDSIALSDFVELQSH